MRPDRGAGHSRAVTDGVAAGLAVLATRFPWAEKPLDYARDEAQEGVEEVAESPWRAAGAVLAP